MEEDTSGMGLLVFILVLCMIALYVVGTAAEERAAKSEQVSHEER